MRTSITTITPPTAAPSKEHVHVGSSPRVLLVEHETAIALALQEALEELGCDVVGVASGASDALDKATFQRPTLLLMESRLKTAPELQLLLIPLLRLTLDAELTRRARDAASEHGAEDAYDARVLVPVVNAALCRYRQSLGVSTSAGATSDDPGSGTRRSIPR